MICNQWDVAFLPFPFIEAPKTKQRPVLIISKEGFNRNNGFYIASMITSSMHSELPGDTPISDLERAGLKKPSIIRLKLFSLDQKLVTEVNGRICDQDIEAFQMNFLSSVA